MSTKKSRDQLVQEFKKFFEGKSSREKLAAAARYYDQATRVKLQPALRQLVDLMIKG